MNIKLKTKYFILILVFSFFCSILLNMSLNSNLFQSHQINGLQIKKINKFNTNNVLGSGEIAVNPFISEKVAKLIPQKKLGVYLGPLVNDYNQQNMNSFAILLRPILIRFTDKTYFESCGMILESKSSSFKRYATILMTSNSHIACVLNKKLLLNNFVSTNISIHSHGGQKLFKMNYSDKILSNDNDIDSNIVYGSDRFHFSATDFAGGAGYLATPIGVIFQNGKKLIKNIK